MNVPRLTLTLLLLIFVCSTSSCLKNDRSESSFDNGPNFIRRSRRIGLNEYLVPPPIPKSHPIRSGRVANPSPTDSPGYFSQIMNWLNPFNFGSSPPTPLKSPSHLEAPYPPPSQPYGPPPFSPHSAQQSAVGFQSGLSLYPPLGSSNPAQYPDPPLNHPSVPPLGLPPGPPLNHPPGPPLNHPPGSPLSLPPGPPLGHPHGPPLNLPPSPSFSHLSGPPLSLSPGPSFQYFNIPSVSFHEIQNIPSTLKDSRGIYLPTNKGKPCNPCNKVPWVPMQGGGSHSDTYPPPSQLSNSYLPPSGQANHDVQYAASHEIKVPDFSQVPVKQNEPPPFNSPLPNPLLYPGPIPPLYKAKPFDRPSQSPPLVENVAHFEPPPLPVTTSTGHEYKNPEINNERYNVRGNDDQRSIGTNINQAHVSIAPQNNEIEINKGITDHKESYDSSILDTPPPVSGPSFVQEYHNNYPIFKPENGGASNQPVQHNQNSISSYGSSNFDNHNFDGQNGKEYHDSLNANPVPNTDLNYLPPDLNPSASFGTSTLHNQDTETLNYQYSDDLSPSGSVVKDSHITTHKPVVTTFSSKEESIHFEESPLLDLTKKGESRTDTQWPTSTIGYTDIDEVSDNTLKTTTDYNLETDNIYFEDSSNFVRPTDSYSSSDIQNINSVFGLSTSTTVDFTNDNRNQQIETSTADTHYTSQQDVSYIPPSGQPGFLWPSLLSNTPNLRNGTSKNYVPLNHLAQWNNSFPEIGNFNKQDRTDLKDTKDSLQKQQNMKRNKQVQVIIPYTSEYTPIPFQQSNGDWSVRTNFERTQPRKVPPRDELNAVNYIQQESRNDIRIANQLQSQFNFNNSNKLNVQSIKPSLTTAEDSRSTTTKVNNSIDVRRLQKNIDNWTIQEYSKPTTSSTILPSSIHPYLSPSKKIPTEYLTTTEPNDRTNESKEHNESVKTYSLAGFSFNEVEHVGSASNHIEATQPPSKVKLDSSKVTASGLRNVNKSTTEEKSTWEAQSVSISPVNKERVYVVTPQPVPEVSSKNDFEKQKGERKGENLQRASEPIADDVSNTKNNFSEFEAIEKAYQVLPQAVNNLAVASTGKENIPLWGIMEHEEFASLNLDENDEEAVEDVVDGPVLYTGHSKVSRAKR